MSKCKNCGREFSGDFCPNCGLKVQKIVCPRCKTTIDSTERFCPICGQELISAPQQQNSETQPSATRPIYDDILNKGFEEAWAIHNPKAKLLLRISYWSGWVLLTLFTISLIIAIVKIFTLIDDVTDFTPENYNSVCLWAKLALSFGIIYLIRRHISSISEYSLQVKWGKFLQNDLSRNPLNLEPGKAKLEDKDFIVLTDKKFYTAQLAILISLLVVALAFSIYLCTCIDELVTIIISMKLSIQLDIPMTSKALDVITPHATFMSILAVIQIALEITLRIVNKYFLKKLG